MRISWLITLLIMIGVCTLGYSQNTEASKTGKPQSIYYGLTVVEPTRTAINWVNDNPTIGVNGFYARKFWNDLAGKVTIGFGHKIFNGYYNNTAAYSFTGGYIALGPQLIENLSSNKLSHYYLGFNLGISLGKEYGAIKLPFEPITNVIDNNKKVNFSTQIPILNFETGFNIQFTKRLLMNVGFELIFPLSTSGIMLYETEDFYRTKYIPGVGSFTSPLKFNLILGITFGKLKVKNS